MIIDLKKHIAITGTEKMAEISLPLAKYYGITYFDYARNYRDGSHVYLANNTNVTQLVFEKQYYHRGLSFKHPDKYEFECALWDGFDHRYSGYKFWEEIKVNFDIAHGYFIVEKNPHYTEVFTFAGSYQNYSLNNIYLNHTQNLRNFILHFREKAELLIAEAYKQRFKSEFSTSLIDTPDDILIQNLKQSSKEFLKRTKIRKVKLIGDFSGISLSFKEVECIKPLLQGGSYKEIARHLNISPRTVESRMEQLRYKLQCPKKQDLIEVLSHEDIRQSLRFF